MADETQIAEEWLYSVLKNDGTLNGVSLLNGQRIYNEVAPQNAAFPYVVFGLRSATDLDKNNGRLLTDTLYSVKVVGQSSSFAQLSAIFSRIDELLHLAQGTVTSGRVIASSREEVFKYVENGDGGVLYHHLGGYFRILARKE